VQELAQRIRTSREGVLEVKTAKEKREEFLREDTSERAKVNAWLDRINETDEACRAEVLERCAKDPEARAYYVMRSEEPN